MAPQILVATLALGGALVFSQSKSAPGVEVQIILTAADHVNHHPRSLNPSDVMITDATITDWVRFDGGRDLDLYIVIDDAADYDFESKLQELRRFVTSQPQLMSIGVAYIHDGKLDVAEKPTRDHDRSARALRAPAGSKTANPYFALSDLIGGWQTKSLRREILMVSTGIDDTGTGSSVCFNARGAIQTAERAGVVVYALYNPAANYLSEKWSKVNSGVINLAGVCYETGGKAYFVSHDPLGPIDPFLSDIAEHLMHQYLVKFRLSPGSESGFQMINVSSRSFDQELMKPESVWVPIPK